RKRMEIVIKTDSFRQQSASIRLVFGPCRSVLSGAEIRTVLYPYRKLTVFGRFPRVYG
ncbi:unnamed protein product, partial [Rotaria socialis]